MAKSSPRQRKTIGRVMHEYAHGELESGPGGKAGKVKSHRQAIAIALSEAGASNQQSPSENRRKLKQTEAKERTGRTAQAQKESKQPKTEPTRQQLYEHARKAGIPGRSHMSKDQLQHALAQHHA